MESFFLVSYSPLWRDDPDYNSLLLNEEPHATVGVIATTAEEAIEKARNETVGEVIEFNDQGVAEMGQEAAEIIDIAVIEVEHIRTIDII